MLFTAYHAANKLYIHRMYIHQLEGWPEFQWAADQISHKLTAIRHRQGRIIGRMEGLGFTLKAEAILQTLTQDVLKSNEIEGEILNPDQVRSSIARRLGMDIPGLIPADRNVDGIVEMMLDATQRYTQPLTADRLFGWHAAMFPTGYSSIYKITVGNWRNNEKGPMQVVSGIAGREEVHYEAPDAALLPEEMERFLNWFNSDINNDPVLKAGIAHLWFVTIHKFEDGNGRIARAIADMQLARADGSSHRFYSMSAQIRQERTTYYKILERTQRSTLDITAWLEWFFDCLNRALDATDITLAAVLKKATFWDKHANTILNERQRLLINKLLDGFEGKLTSSKWAKIAKCSQDTALRDLQYLVDKEILIKELSGGRSTSYILKEKPGLSVNSDSPGI
jgi:Fic family protein